MKKLITAILAVALILTSFSSAFAAVSIDDVFVDADGTHFFFGRFDYSRAEDAGVEVNGKAYSLNPAGGMDYNDLPQNLWKSAKRNGRFGVGLKDSKDIIGEETAEVKPYEVIEGEKVYGEAVSFNGAADKTPVGDEIISSITVGEEVLKGVDSSISEYYYGLDELPDEASGLPAVTVATSNEIVGSETVAEMGGFTHKVIVKSGENEFEYKVYFRKNETVTLTNTKLLSSKGGYVRNDNTGYANIVSNEYGYAEFAADAIAGDECVITGASLNANFKFNLEEITIGVSAYDSADMLIGDVGPFLNRDFVTFRTIGSVTPESKDAYYDVNLDYSKFRTDSSKIVLVMKKAGSLATYLYSPKLTIKYVKKNPGIYDATLKEIKVDGVAVKNFDPNVYEYYVGVENPDAAHEITATPSYSESVVTVSGNTITVKPVIGETRTYNIYIRKLNTLTVTATEGAIIKSNGTIQQNASGPQACDETSDAYVKSKIKHQTISYQEFDLSGITANDIILDAEITADVFYVGAAPTNIYWYRSAYDTYAAITPGGYHKEFTVHWEDARKPVLLGSFSASEKIKVNTHVDFTSKLDASELNVVNNKVVLAATKGFGEENSTSIIYMEPKSTMTIKYVEKVLGASDATLSEIKVDGVALEGFDPEVTEYYYGVDSLENLPEITATAKAASSQVTVSGNTITVKPLVGESKVYTVNFREFQELTVTASDCKSLTWKGTTQQSYNGPVSIDPTSSSYTTYGIEQSVVQYQLFDFSTLPENSVIIEAELIADVYYSNVAPTTIYWSRSVYDTLEAIPTSEYHKEFSARWTEVRKPVLLGSFTINDVIAVNKHFDFTAKLDASEFNLVDKKMVIAATKGFGEENSTSAPYITGASDITIKYFVK